MGHKYFRYYQDEKGKGEYLWQFPPFEETFYLVVNCSKQITGSLEHAPDNIKLPWSLSEFT